MNKISYETIMVINPTLGDEGVASIIEKFKSLIENNATIDGEIEEWGKRKLAYEIDDQKEGYYVLINFTSDPMFPAELNRIYKITDGILRSLTVKKVVKKNKKKDKKDINQQEENVNQQEKNINQQENVNQNNIEE